MDEPLACSGLKASPSFHQASILLLQKAVGRENQTWAQNHFVAPGAVTTLREHRRNQLELRMALRLGRPDPEALVFYHPDGSTSYVPRAPPYPCERLIAGNIDVVQISRRIGYGSPAVTVRRSAHLFKSSDSAAIEAAHKQASKRDRRNRVPILTLFGGTDVLSAWPA